MSSAISSTSINSKHINNNAVVGKLQQLHSAVLSGDKANVEKLINQGVNINQPPTLGDTFPLEAAVLDGHLEVVELLLQNGASLNALDGPDPIKTLLIPAFEKAKRLSLSAKNDSETQASLKMAQLLSDQLCKELSDSSNTFPISSLMSLICSAPKEIATDSLITHVVNSFNGSDINKSILDHPNQWTLSHFAYSRGQARLAEALSVAVLDGHLEVVELLLQNGASLNALDDPISSLMSLICSAPKGIATDSLITRVVNSFNESNINKSIPGHLNQWTPLHYACSRGQAGLVKQLIEAGAEINHKSFSAAVSGGHLEVVECLLQNGASLNALDDPITTLLLPAFKNAERPSLNAKDDSETQASLEMAQLLSDQLCKELSDSSNKFPISSLMSLICSAPKEIATDSLITHVVNSFNGSNINKSIPDNPNQWTPLHYACHHGHVKLVKQLIKKGAEINYSSLQAAVFAGHVEVVKTLLEKSKLSFKSDELVEVLTKAKQYYNFDNQKAQNLFEVAELLLASDKVSIEGNQLNPLQSSEFIKDLCRAPEEIDINNLIGLAVEKNLFSIETVDQRISLLGYAAKQGDLKRVDKLISDATIGEVVKQGIEEASRNPKVSAESLQIAALLLQEGYSVKEQGDQLIELLLDLMIHKVNHSPLQKQPSQPLEINSLLINQESTLPVIQQLINRLSQQNTQKLEQGKALLGWLIDASNSVENPEAAQQFFDMAWKWAISRGAFNSVQYLFEQINKEKSIIDEKITTKETTVTSPISNIIIDKVIARVMESAPYRLKALVNAEGIIRLSLQQNYPVKLPDTAIGDLVKAAEKQAQSQPKIAKACLITANQLLEKGYAAKWYSDTTEQRTLLQVVCGLGTHEFALDTVKQIIKQLLQNKKAIDPKINPLSTLPNPIVEALAKEVLFDAVKKGNLKAIECFIKCDSKYANFAKDNGETLLHAWAALPNTAENSMKIGGILLGELEKSEINALFNEKTAVDIAKSHNNKDVLKFLEKAGGRSNVEIKRAAAIQAFAQRIFQVVVQTPYRIFIQTPYQGISYLFGKLSSVF